MADSNLAVPSLSSPRPHPHRNPHAKVTDEDLVARVWVLEDQNNLLRQVNATMSRLLEDLREATDNDTLWNRSMAETRAQRNLSRQGMGARGDGGVSRRQGAGVVRCTTGSSGGQGGWESPAAEDDMHGNKGHQIVKQLLHAFREETRSWPSMVLIFIFLVSKFVDFIVDQFQTRM